MRRAGYAGQLGKQVSRHHAHSPPHPKARRQQRSRPKELQGKAPRPTVKAQGVSTSSRTRVEMVNAPADALGRVTFCKMLSHRHDASHRSPPGDSTEIIAHRRTTGKASSGSFSTGCITWRSSLLIAKRPEACCVKVGYTQLDRSVRVHVRPDISWMRPSCPLEHAIVCFMDLHRHMTPHPVTRCCRNP